MIGWYQRQNMMGYLKKWMRTLLAIYPAFPLPDLRLDPGLRSIAYFNHRTKAVRINPVRYGKDPQAQYRVSKALTTHELGHHIFSPTRSRVTPLLHQVHNILEDGRIDRIWCRTPGSVGRTIRYLYRLLKQHTLADTEPNVNLLAPHPSVLLNGCILANWRDHLGLPLETLRFTPAYQKLWVEQVLPRTRAAWQVAQPEAERVWDIAEQILDVLGLKTEADLDESVRIILGGLEALEGHREADEEGPAGEPIAGDAPEDLCAGEDEEEAADNQERKETEDLNRINRDLNRPAPSEEARWPAIEPEPYAEFEEAIQGSLRQVLRVLTPRPVPEERFPSEDSGRPVPKNILFTPDTPFEAVTEPVRPQRVPVHVRVIVDRSSSMAAGAAATMRGKKERAAIMASMLIHLAACRLGIEHEIVVTPGRNRLAYLKAGERGKALLAGIRGETATEDMNRTLFDQGMKLLASRATHRVLYVIHDGYPDTPEQCARTISAFRRKGLRVIGVGLELESCGATDPAGHCGECEACRMWSLFGEGLILASADDMHTHIASSLKSLRVFV